MYNMLKKAMITYNVVIAFIFWRDLMTKIYFNHDGGVDDLISLFLLLQMDNVELVGVKYNRCRLLFRTFSRVLHVKL